MAALMHRLFSGWLVLINIGCLRLLRNLNWYLWGKIAGCDRYFAPRTLSCLGRRPQSSSQAAWPVLERGIAYCGYLPIWVGQLALQVCVHRIWYMTMRYNEYVETQGIRHTPKWPIRSWLNVIQWENHGKPMTNQMISSVSIPFLDQVIFCAHDIFSTWAPPTGAMMKKVTRRSSLRWRENVAEARPKKPSRLKAFTEICRSR